MISNTATLTNSCNCMRSSSASSAASCEAAWSTSVMARRSPIISLASLGSSSSEFTSMCTRPAAKPVRKAAHQSARPAILSPISALSSGNKGAKLISRAINASMLPETNDSTENSSVTASTPTNSRRLSNGNPSGLQTVNPQTAPCNSAGVSSRAAFNASAYKSDIDGEKLCKKRPYPTRTQTLHMPWLSGQTMR